MSSPMEASSTSSPWTFVVDCKEPNADAISTCAQKTLNVPCHVSNLAVADYWWTKDEKVWVAIERKTLSDLQSSITHDGRYYDQRFRLLNSNIPYIFLLIEGSPLKLGEKENTRMNSAILHLQMHKAFKVAWIRSSDEFMPWLVKMLDYLSNEPSEEHLTAPFVDTIQTNCRKRKLKTQDDIFVAQLMCISGVSEHKAKTIQKTYPGGWPMLLRAYENCKTEKSKMQLLIDVSDGKRRLGPVISERIYQCLYTKT